MPELDLSWRKIGYSADDRPDMALRPVAEELLRKRSLDPDDPNQVFRFLQGCLQLFGTLRAIDVEEVEQVHGMAGRNVIEYVTIWAGRYFWQAMNHLMCLVPAEGLHTGVSTYQVGEVDLFTLQQWEEYRLAALVEEAFREYRRDTQELVLIQADPVYHDAAFGIMQGVSWLGAGLRDDLMGVKLGLYQVRYAVRQAIKPYLCIVHPDVMREIAWLYDNEKDDPED
jgi:hypothetical protein